MEKNNLWKEIFLYVLAAIITAGEITMIMYLIYIWQHGASSDNKDVINLIYGLGLAYHSVYVAVISYFVGTTQGSARKNDMIYNSTPNTEVVSVTKGKEQIEEIEEVKTK
jgi:hypothetical protein